MWSDWRRVFMQAKQAKKASPSTAQQAARALENPVPFKL
jgi:hypothetical protein